ncbi:MAG: ferrous iron transport protein A [Christensenellales bacterium]
MQEKNVVLSNLKVKEAGYITKIGGNLKIKNRLCELGFTKGTLVRVLNISSLKQSYLLEIRGYILALRKSAVNLITVIPSKENLK